MKKLTRILVTCLMILSLSVTAFAAELPKGASERGYSFYYRDGEDGIIETPLREKSQLLTILPLILPYLRGEFIPILLPKPPKVFMMGIIP